MNHTIALNPVQLLYLWQTIWLYQVWQCLVWLEQQTEVSPPKAKPLQGQKNQQQGDAKKKLSVTDCCIKRKQPSIRQPASSVPIFANGAMTAAFVHLYNAEGGLRRKIIDHTSAAVKHYYDGNGASVELGPNTKATLENHPEQIRRFDNIQGGSLNQGNYGIDLTFSSLATFHVGDTTVQYSTLCAIDSCRTTFTGFTQNLPGGGYGADGFWDANVFTGWNHDGPGPGSEFGGGSVYFYTPHSWTRDWP